eukprot:scaffold751_cov395-Prasinococcus_capsulatus_cf.AAC.2
MSRYPASTAWCFLFPLGLPCARLVPAPPGVEPRGVPFPWRWGCFGGREGDGIALPASIDVLAPLPAARALLNALFPPPRTPLSALPTTVNALPGLTALSLLAASELLCFAGVPPGRGGHVKGAAGDKLWLRCEGSPTWPFCPSLRAEHCKSYHSVLTDGGLTLSNCTLELSSALKTGFCPVSPAGGETEFFCTGKLS